MLKATLREYMGSVERDKRSLLLDRTLGTITIGRGGECTYQIGKTLGDWAKGIGRVQATIEFTEDTITLVDGSREKASTNGIWLHGEPIQGAIALTPGMDLTLFKAGLAKVSLIINDTEAVHDHGKDTYTGEDLLSVLQLQVSRIEEQGQRMQEQVLLLAEQLTHREAIDTAQETRLLATEKRLNRMVALVLGAIAVIVLATGFLGGGSNEERKQWSSGLTSVAIGAAALYFKYKEKELEVKKV